MYFVILENSHSINTERTLSFRSPPLEKGLYSWLELWMCTGRLLPKIWRSTAQKSHRSVCFSRTQRVGRQSRPAADSRQCLLFWNRASKCQESEITRATRTTHARWHTAIAYCGRPFSTRWLGSCPGPCSEEGDDKQDRRKTPDSLAKRYADSACFQWSEKDGCHFPLT